MGRKRETQFEKGRKAGVRDALRTLRRDVMEQLPVVAIHIDAHGLHSLCVRVSDVVGLAESLERKLCAPPFPVEEVLR